MHWLHRAVPTQPFVKSFGKLSSVLCYQKATQISLHHIFWWLSLQIRTGLQGLVYGGDLCFRVRLYKEILVGIVKETWWWCRVVQQPPGSLEQRLWDVQIVIQMDLFFFFLSPAHHCCRVGECHQDSSKKLKKAKKNYIRKKTSSCVILPRPFSEMAFPNSAEDHVSCNKSIAAVCKE